MEKNLQYFQSLRYEKELTRQIDQGSGEVYFAVEITELPSVIATGNTRAEALYNIDLVFDDYITSSLEWGDTINEPALKRPEIKPLPKRIASHEVEPEKDFAESNMRDLLIKSLIKRQRRTSSDLQRSPSEFPELSSVSM